LTTRPAVPLQPVGCSVGDNSLQGCYHERHDATLLRAARFPGDWQRESWEPTVSGRRVNCAVGPILRIRHRRILRMNCAVAQFRNLKTKSTAARSRVAGPAATTATSTCPAEVAATKLKDGNLGGAEKWPAGRSAGLTAARDGRASAGGFAATEKTYLKLIVGDVHAFHFSDG